MNSQYQQSHCQRQTVLDKQTKRQPLLPTWDSCCCPGGLPLVFFLSSCLMLPLLLSFSHQPPPSRRSCAHSSHHSFSSVVVTSHLFQGHDTIATSQQVTRLRRCLDRVISTSARLLKYVVLIPSLLFSLVTSHEPLHLILHLLHFCFSRLTLTHAFLLLGFVLL